MPPSSSIPAVLADLADEHDELDVLVATLDEAGWDTPTPAPHWAVRDQVSHLAFFDEAATSAVVEPRSFIAGAQAAMALVAGGADPMAEHLARGRALAGADVLGWWREARAGFLRAAHGLGPGERVPWYGPAMSPLSFVAARLMETWAHGQDVADALGLERRPTRRLVHVARLGVRARPFSYVVRGLEPPAALVRVELEAPDGEHWVWDDEGDTADVVRGTALDFCLVVTQRRHVSDTGLVVEGAVANEWMTIAQAFAGPPGPGRPSSAR